MIMLLVLLQTDRWNRAPTNNFKILSLGNKEIPNPRGSKFKVKLYYETEQYIFNKKRTLDKKN